MPAGMKAAFANVAPTNLAPVLAGVLFGTRTVHPSPDRVRPFSFAGPPTADGDRSVSSSSGRSPLSPSGAPFSAAARVFSIRRITSLAKASMRLKTIRLILS